MKKTVKRPDGTEEVVEGTAEELAEFERRRGQEELREVPQKKGRRLLTEADKAELREMFEEELKKRPHQDWHFHSYPGIYAHGWGCQCVACRPAKQWWEVENVPIGPFLGGGTFCGTGDKIAGVLDVGDSISEVELSTFGDVWNARCKTGC